MYDYGIHNRIQANILRFYEKFPTHPRIAKLKMLFPNYKVFEELLATCGDIVEYFRQCYDQYGETPGEKSIPMCALRDKCKACNYRLIAPWGKVNAVIQLVVDLIEQGADSKCLKAIYERMER